jgi:hypothetical protein
MLQSILGVLAVIIGLAIYYVRAISVLIDEEDNIKNSLEYRERHAWLYNVSKQLEKIWPLVKDENGTKWAVWISNISLALSITLLIFTGLFEDFAKNNAGVILVSLFFLSTLANGPKSIEKYEKIKPYLFILMPAMFYQVTHWLQFQNPDFSKTLIISGYTYQDSKYLAAVIGLLLVPVLPFAIAKFESWFSMFISQTTLYFARDFLRLGVKPTNDEEKGLRKIAKEIIAVSLSALLAIIGFLVYLLNKT